MLWVEVPRGSGISSSDGGCLPGAALDRLKADLIWFHTNNKAVVYQEEQEILNIISFHVFGHLSCGNAMQMKYKDVLKSIASEVKYILP